MRFLLPILVVALVLLAGCGSLKERQDRAHEIINTTTETLDASVNKAIEAGKEMHEGVTGAADAAMNVVDRTEKKIQDINKGVEKINDSIQEVTNTAEATIDAAKGLGEDIDEVKNSITGTEE